MNQVRQAIWSPGVGRGGNSGNATQSAASILLSDATLRTAYLLNNPRSSNPVSLTDEKAARFLLWFAVEGWKRYQHVVFSPAYLAFLATPVPPYASRLAAYVLLLRTDLRERFGADPNSFHAWYYTEGIAEYGLTPLIGAKERMALAARLAPREISMTYDKPAADRSAVLGVNIIGFGNNVMGIGEDVRALAAALGRAGIPRVIVNVSLADEFGTSAPHRFDALRCDRPLFPVNIFAMPAFETARLHIEHGAQFFHRRHSIGYWPWELTSLPAQWHGVFDLVDEVWAPSRFLYDVYRRLTDKPVIYMPPYLNVPKPEAFGLDEYGVAADDCVFLTMFDFNSFTARKNPEGVVAAFQKAFPSLGTEKLVIKTLNSHGQPAAFQRLKALIGSDERCILIDKVLTRPQTAGLIASADCLISLHRAEGFGRVIAEAMALGTIVVATDWSGSTSILDRTRGYPVSYSLRDVAAGEYIYNHGSQWAEPSIEDAAVKLRTVRDRLDCDGELRRCAREFVENTYGVDTVAAALTNRLEILTVERSGASE